MGSARNRSLGHSLSKIPYYDYGDPPEIGKDYWENQTRSEIPGDPYTLTESQTFEAEGVIFDKADHHKDRPVDASEIVEDYKSQFLDEMYGTDRDPTTDGAVGDATVDTTVWGLDLRRVQPNEDWNIRSPEYYEHLTKGAVDWGNYQSDDRYKAAFTALGYDITSLGTDIPQSVQAIRHANVALGGELESNWLDDYKGGHRWVHRWDDQHDEDHIVRVGDDLYEHGKRQETLSEKYAAGKGRLTISDQDVKNVMGKEFSPLATVNQQIAQVVKPDLNIQKVEVKGNAEVGIPQSWGSTQT